MPAPAVAAAPAALPPPAAALASPPQVTPGSLANPPDSEGSAASAAPLAAVSAALAASWGLAPVALVSPPAAALAPAPPPAAEVPAAAPAAAPKPPPKQKRSALLEPAAVAERKSRRGVPTVSAEGVLPDLDAAAPLVMPLSPASFYYDWAARSPMATAEVVAQMLEESKSLTVPEGWWSEAALLEPYSEGGAHTLDVDPSSVSEFDALDAAMQRLAACARAPTTLSAYRNPFLKYLYWRCCHADALAGTSFFDSAAVARYLTRLVLTRANSGAPVIALRALNYVARLNGVPALVAGSVAMIPLEAAGRMFAGETRKVRELDAPLVAAVYNALCPNGVADIEAQRPEAMLAVAIIACFKCFGRFADLCRLRWDDAYCAVADDAIEFFIDIRKNDQMRKGHLCTVALSESAELGGASAYAVLVAAKKAFVTGPVLRRIGKSGGADVLREPFFEDGKVPKGAGVAPGDGPFMMNMLYGDYVARLRTGLILAGVSPEEAKEYAAHSARAGAATSASRAGVPEHIIKDAAGVTSDKWVLIYDRIDRDRRCGASLAIGL